MSLQATWLAALALLAGLAAVALSGDRRTLVALEVEAMSPTAAFEGPEQLAERVRYSDVFEAREHSLTVEASGARALVMLSLVEETRAEPPAVAEVELSVPRHPRGRFALTRTGRYRLRVVAEGEGSVRIEVIEGRAPGVALGLAAFLLLIPPFIRTRQWMRARKMG